jgi:hypothetical protein
MLRAAACALRAATSRSSPTLGRVRCFAEPSAAANASPELERLRLEFALAKTTAERALALERVKAERALALEERALALERVKAEGALALEKKKGEHALALEDLKAAQARGLWEALFGIKRKTAHLLNFAAGGALVFASSAYLVTGMLYADDSWARTQGTLSKDDQRSVCVLCVQPVCLYAPTCLG